MKKTVREHLDAREKELKATFEEMICILDRYSKITPFTFIDCEHIGPGDYLPRPDGRFNKFHSWVERWMGVVFPNTIRNQERIENIADEADIDAIYMDLAFDALRFGYTLGYLAGCHAMGADRQTLTAKAQGFILQDLFEHEARERKQA
jgi:hypothetical protein